MSVVLDKAFGLTPERATELKIAIMKTSPFMPLESIIEGMKATIKEMNMTPEEGLWLGMSFVAGVE